MAEHAVHTEGSSAGLGSRWLYVVTDFSCSMIIQSKSFQGHEK